MDGKVDPKDLEKVINRAMRRTQQRLRDAEAHTVDLRAELEQLKTQATQMAPMEERKRMVMERRNRAKQNKAQGDRKKVRGGAGEFQKAADVVQTFLDRPWKDHFIGIGTSEEVPRILRHTGKIRNKAFTKIECEQKVKEIWQAKLAEDKRNGGNSLPMDEFMYDFIKASYAGHSRGPFTSPHRL